MSLGWLTESALSVKPAKPIQVPGGSLANLQAIVYERESSRKRLLDDTGSTRTKPTPKFLSKAEQLFTLRNEGVESRERSDEAAFRESEKTLDASKRKLEEKAKMYDHLMSGGDREDKNSNGLVDFRKKRSMTDSSGATTKEELNLLITKSPPHAPASGGETLVSSDMRKEQQRKAWEVVLEREMLSAEKQGDNNSNRETSNSDAEHDDDETTINRRNADDPLYLDDEGRFYLQELDKDIQVKRSYIVDQKQQMKDELKNRLKRLREAKKSGDGSAAAIS